MTVLSVLDLAPIVQGGTAAEALAQSLRLAQHAESLGYERFWLAEHHNMPGVASAATAVVIGHVAGGTRRIRVGSGGIMLPNHAPLVIAEQFGTLASLYPGRIDLGLGRAPGSDMATARALRRDRAGGDERFPDDIRELQGYFAPATPEQRVMAVPGTGLEVPVWLLGSSLYSAQLAAAMGLPYAFAAHFAPGQMVQALEIYRSQFRASASLAQPRVMLCVNVFAADSDAEAAWWFSSQQQAFVNLHRSMPGQLPPPVHDMDLVWTPLERAWVTQSLKYAMVGSAAVIRESLAGFLADHRPDELMVTGHFHDPAARLRSLEITAEVMRSLA